MHATVALDKHKNLITLKCDFRDNALAKTIPGYKWDRTRKRWTYPVHPDTIRHIRETFPLANIDLDVIEAVATLVKQQEQADLLKAAGWEAADPLETMPIKAKPFRHQILGYNLGITIPAVALLMEQGCGKTLTSIAIAGRRFQRGEVQRVLVCAPTSMVPVWPKEFEQYADFPHDVRALEGPVKERERILADWKTDPNTLQVAIINYEATWRMEDAITRWKPDMIICDESQRIKTPGAKQSKTLHRLGKLAKYRLILTGTPVTQSPLDFFSQYKFLDPSIFGDSYYAFKARYAVEQPIGDTRAKKVIGYKNLGELVKKAHSVAFRVTKAEALDLPEQVDQVLYATLEPKAQKLYNQMLRESVAELSEEKTIAAPNILSKLLRLSQLAGGFAGEGGEVEQVSNAKLSLLKEALDDLLGAGKKVVIFARFIPEIEAILELLKECDVGYSWIAGAVPQSERGPAVERFQKDEDCRVFVAQLQTAGLGITLTAADTAIFYSLDYSYANYEQCRARIHRIGQRNTCTYIHLIARGTVDEDVMEALRRKKNVADLVVDRWKEILMRRG